MPWPRPLPVSWDQSQDCGESWDLFWQGLAFRLHGGYQLSLGQPRPPPLHLVLWSRFGGVGVLFSRSVLLSSPLTSSQSGYNLLRKTLETRSRSTPTHLKCQAHRSFERGNLAKSTREQLPFLGVLAKKGCLSRDGPGRGRGRGQRLPKLSSSVRCAHWLTVPSCQVRCQDLVGRMQGSGRQSLPRVENLSHTHL